MRNSAAEFFSLLIIMHAANTVAVAVCIKVEQNGKQVISDSPLNPLKTS